MGKELMIDYLDEMEFCVRDGDAYFISEGEKDCVPLEKVFQVYTN